MYVYRLTRPEYANDLSGFGASLQGGRWNHPGEFLLYTAQTSSLSILEVLVHLNGVTRGLMYALIVLEVASDVLILDEKSFVTPLKDDWQSTDGVDICRQIGSEWIRRKSSPILKVPSALNPLEHNYLINPHHPNTSIKVVDKSAFFYDGRLMKD